LYRALSDLSGNPGYGSGRYPSRGCYPLHRSVACSLQAENST